MADVEIVQQAYEAWFRGDEAGMMALVHPEIVVTQIPEQVDTRPYHGHDGLRAVMADWVGSWDDYSIEMYDGLNGPYTYSDMTGGALNNVTCNPPEG